MQASSRPNLVKVLDIKPLPEPLLRLLPQLLYLQLANLISQRLAGPSYVPREHCVNYRGVNIGSLFNRNELLQAPVIYDTITKLYTNILA